MSIQAQPESDKRDGNDDQSTVNDFPLSEEERNRRILAVAEQLAAGVAGSWTLWYKRRAEQLGIEPKILADLIKAQIADREQKERKAQEEARLGEKRAQRQRLSERDRQREQQRIEEAAEKKAKQKGQGFADIIKLPSDQHESKLAELAKKLDEDVASLSEGFAEYAATETSSSAASESGWDVEPWPEPVTTAAVLEALIARINAHVVAEAYKVLAVALWTLMDWVHEVAHYSVYLATTSPIDYCGKTTLLIEVLGRLVSKPAPMGSNLTNIFRLTDRERPSVLIDNADKLFERNKDITDLFLNGWTRGIPVRRNEKIGGEWVSVEFDVFCPKAISLIGTKLPAPLLGRCLLIELLRAMPGENLVEVDPFNEELMQQFKILKRQLARWADDNLAALKTATPVFPAGLTTRPKANAKLLLAIAELAGSEWAELARSALERLLREEREPSWLERLLQELWTVFFEENRKVIGSEELIKRLIADPTSEWCNYGGKRVNQWDVGALLKKVHTSSRLVGNRRVGGYHRLDFLENKIFQRWLGREPLNLSPPAPEQKKPRSQMQKTKKLSRSRSKKKSPRKVRG